MTEEGVNGQPVPPGRDAPAKRFVPSLIRWFRDTWTAEEGSRTLSHSLAWIKARLLGPGSRRIRSIFIVSAVIQLVLAPLTSWSNDTPSFVGAAIALIYRGSPYATDQLFNPPLGPFLEAPFFAILAIWATPQSLVSNVAAITPAASVSGVSTQIPSSGALLALKVPLIIAMLFTGLCITYICELIVGRDRSTGITAAWLLNPLVIWATAVHGEADVLACAAICLFVIALLQRWYFLAGISLALGMISKAYPVALLPCSILAVNFSNRPPHDRAPTSCIARFLVGLTLTLSPFVVFLPNLEAIDSGLSTASYGGFNLLLLFNPGEYSQLLRFDPAIFSESTANLVRIVFAGIFVSAIAGSLLLAYIASYVTTPTSRVVPSKTLVCAFVLPTSAVLMYQSSPQSENLLLFLSVALLLMCYGGRIAKATFWLVTAAGLVLYMTLASPVAFFYPLAVMGGGPWISALNSIVIRYRTNTIVAPQNFWLISGVLGAGCIIAVCALSFYQLVKELAYRVVPPHPRMDLTSNT